MDWAATMAQVEVEVGKEENKKSLADLAQSLELVRFALYSRLAQLTLDNVPPKSDLLTIPQLAQRLQVKPSTLYQRVARGQLESTRIGKLIRVKEADAIKPVRRSRVQRLV